MMSTPEPRSAALTRDSARGRSRVTRAQSLRADKNRVLMAFGGMEESGKWTERLMERNGSEHLLSPDSLLSPGLFLASPVTAQAAPPNSEPCSGPPWPPTGL